MALTPETLVRHELVGLEVAVVAAPNPDLVGLAGRAVAETTRTIGIEADDDLAVVPKAETTFEWTLPDGETVRTAGERLLARTARRTERTGDSTWR